MVFSSLVFVSIFLPTVFLLNLLVRPLSARNALLIIASLVFYSYGEPIYVLLMLASCLLNWFFAYLIGDAKRVGDTASEDVTTTIQSRRKLWLTLAIIANLGMLGVFKYAGMVVTTVNAALPIDLSVPEIALPIGISFYTFQALSYMIDCYRGTVKPSRNPLAVMLYISFFPQLIAGPIVRYRDIEHQIADRHIDTTDVALGLRRFIIGLTKKVLIADTLATVVDQIYASPTGEIDAAAAWLAAFAYALQIYFDFSGYSDMAIGMARMFGFRFRENFTYPYAAGTIQDFWRRWHISLSTWFLEYLYIPLGGNRRGQARTVINKFTVFLLCGLWHGAAWTFVVWGLLHGLFLMLEELVPIRRLPAAIRHAYTLLVVTLTFIVFRSESFGQALDMFARLFGLRGADNGRAGVLALSFLDPLTVLVLVFAVVAMLPTTRLLLRFPVLAEMLGVRDSGKGTRAPVIFEARTWTFIGAVALLIVNVMLLAAGGYHPFIYFRF